MSPLHKALYRDFFKSEPDERQEGIINAELARCLIYIYWLNFALFILKTAHERLEGVFMSGMAAILFLNLIFISVFIFTNSASRELQKQKPDITRKTWRNTWHTIKNGPYYWVSFLSSSYPRSVSTAWHLPYIRYPVRFSFYIATGYFWV
ncbi:hypothetical protein [Cardiobacterium valvarum]|uniref:Uncharacterized protein n=1 Tax=Cardiobacterium valvarum TaxID=194702 RepID=A0A381E5Q5_9GAMM|nr:hypothetical protein [Cardiobacterium valvarum]SUX21591.1 Uncharacterised protein [Cardiobacterium valvarum]